MFRILTSCESNRAIRVNFAAVAFVDPMDSKTRIHFVAHGMYVDVKETVAALFPEPEPPKGKKNA